MKQRGKIVRWLAVGALLSAGAWGIFFWLRYPKVPDADRLSARQAIEFLAGADFNRMTGRHQTSFVLAVLNKQRHDLNFEQLVALMIDPTQESIRQQMVLNIKRMNDAPELGGKLFELYLDKFYELPSWRRNLYLTTFAFAQEGKFGPQAVKYNLPSPDNFMQVMNEFVRRGPRGQALSVQFMMDLNAHRKMMGLAVK
jgi:hypothetical protein